MSFILEHLFKGLASILLIYIAGHISYAFFRDKERSFDNEYLTEFIKLVLGTFVLTASYAVITTQMKTIFLGFFVIGLALFISDKSILNSWFRSIEKIKKINFKNLAFILLAFTPFYLWQVYNIYDYQSNNFYHTHPDFYFYAGLIDFFNTIGKEQNTINYFGADNTITLYHYGELWLSALFSKVFNTLPLFSFYLYTWSIFFLLTTVGALAILKAFEIPPAYITLLFITLPISFWYPKITIFQGLWLPSSFNYPKYLFVYIYVIFGILILHYRINIKYLSAVTGITVLFNTSIGPTIFLFHFLFLVYWWLQKQINIRALIGNMTFLLIPNCFIAFTFLINKSDKTYDLTLNWLFNSEYSYTYIEYVKTVLYLVRGVAVKTFFSMALAFVLIAISKNIKIFILSNIHVWIYLFMGVFVSFWVYGVFWIISPTDAVQFWYQLTIPITTIVLLILTSKFMIEFNIKTQSLLFLFLIVLHFFEKKETLLTPKTFISPQLLEISKIPNIERSVFVKDSIHYINIFVKNINCFTPISNIVHYKKSCWPIALSLEQIRTENNVNDIDIINIIKNSVFFKFIKQQHKTNSFVNLEQSKLDFIKKYSIQYLIVYKNSKIPEILNTISYKLIYKLEDFTLYQLKY